ncbi:hypothetical protein ACFWBN_02745 [Streptomyces sp. NPDC059989]|uniref:hypothetical protein n=1 Tax=Streptomyces sp. NPDC059989 TaxID=3347026 RepID=UPI0036BC586F
MENLNVVSDSLLQAAELGDRASLSESDLRLFWSRLSGSGEAEADYFIHALVGCVQGGGEEEAAPLEVRLGGWQLNLSQAIAKSALATAFLSASLAVTGGGADVIAPQIITAVTPLLFEIRKVKVTASQGLIHAELVRVSEVQDGEFSAQELYDRIPERHRESLNYLDFLDFLDAYRRAGLLVDDGDSRLRVVPSGNARFRFSIE